MRIETKGMDINMNEQEVQYEIERLLHFALQQALLKPMDTIPARNALLELFHLNEPYGGEVIAETTDSAVPILEQLLNYASAHQLIPENNSTHRDLFDAKIMGMLIPRASEISDQFWRIAKEESIKAAMDHYYKLSINSNYIRMDRIRKNKHWLAATPFGELEITINLSKPEKDPKEIAAERSFPQSQYPRCLLCEENVGFAGRINYPARQNHRIIPIQLVNESWFIQYSPYVYYNEHSIIFNQDHVPMKISHTTFERFLDFVEQVPHYFVGSNADLPIVGGSILNHDHFQGGNHAFPMELASIEQTYKHADYPEVTAGRVKWPMSVIRLTSTNKAQLIKASCDILDQWKEYSDFAVEIKAYSQENDNQIPHNTITPIARRNKSGAYEMDLVLRNNRTDDSHAFGIFHPRESLHHIKKENIGLIEVMGLAILPGRLLSEIDGIISILTGDKPFNEIKSNEQHSLQKHENWIKELIDTYGTSLDLKKAAEIMERQLGDKFLLVLLDAGVYKQDQKGQEGFQRFMEHVNYK